MEANFEASSLFYVILFLVLMAGIFLLIVPFWKLFTKAGQSGWKTLIPIYNVYIMVEIAGLPWWTFLGIFIPIVNFVVLIVILYHISQRFGHGMGYALGMAFLPFIFYPVIAYGSSVYTQPLTPTL